MRSMVALVILYTIGLATGIIAGMGSVNPRPKSDKESAAVPVFQLRLMTGCDCDSCPGAGCPCGCRAVAIAPMPREKCPCYRDAAEQSKPAGRVLLNGPNYGVDVKRLGEEKPRYGPGFVAPKK